ncbi:hypothetical protein LOTGIDRAFT_169057 [Lottia gigantea]|uniref:Major facilitator superfamily (MFS) profile domain-containing protein n=1 Tax=Lottia gigantea TaxID=225164 RepID=V3ZHW9_LOTGI|nr:hypothetical protein LOTGIDRAFT_169057 [Lottia gigantea]ESO83822.1 hypothetical protein LOTGIDRAFT_169057 [Lottia gigantea]
MKSGKTKLESNDIDRGWAWLIVAAVFVYHMLSYGLAWSAGVYYAILIEAFPHQPKVMVAWAGSLPTFGLYAAGPFSAMLTNKFGCRPILMLGGMMSGFGMMASYFAPNIYVLYATFGIITGLGIGLSYIPAITALTLYFQKYRNIATGIAVSGAGFGCFIFPPLINTLSDMYSWRESMLIIGAIVLNIVVCGCVVRPISSFHINQEEKPKVIDFSPLRKKGYLILSVNVVMLSFGLSIVYLHLTAYSEACGYTDNKSAMLMSSIGAANLCGRFALGATANHPRVNVIVLYAVSNIISGVASICFAFSGSSYIALVFLAVVFGFFTACFGALLPPILVELLGIRRFSNGYGCLLIFMAIGQLMGGPFAGFLYDTTGTYEVSFFIAGGTLIIAGLAMKLIGCWGKKTFDDGIPDYQVAFIENGEKVKLDYYDICTICEAGVINFLILRRIFSIL